MKARALLQVLREELSKVDPVGAEIEAWVLLSTITGLSKTQLMMQPDQVVTESQIDTVKAAIAQRQAQRPLAYILGEAEFMGRRYAVSEDVLIPRPETEILVEAARDWVRQKGVDTSDLCILECGLGSGIISIEMALAFPEATVHAWDVSEPALALARQNIQSHGVSVRPHHGDFFAAEAQWAGLIKTHKHTLLLSNPPYIHPEDWAHLDASVRDYEPKVALVADNEGHDFYERFLEIHSRYSVPAIVELGYKQWAYLLDRVPPSSRVIKDYQGIDRVLVLE